VLNKGILSLVTVGLLALPLSGGTVKAEGNGYELLKKSFERQAETSLQKSYVDFPTFNQLGTEVKNDQFSSVNSNNFNKMDTLNSTNFSIEDEEFLFESEINDDFDFADNLPFGKIIVGQSLPLYDIDFHKIVVPNDGIVYVSGTTNSNAIELLFVVVQKDFVENDSLVYLDSLDADGVETQAYQAKAGTYYVGVIDNDNDYYDDNTEDDLYAIYAEFEDNVAPNRPSVNSVDNNDLVVTGKAEPNSTVTVKVGTTQIGTAKATSTGVFSVNIPVQKAGTNLSVSAKDSTGNVSSSASVTVVLAVPSSPKAASASYSSIKTSWTAVSGASGYEVYRATSSTGTYSLVGKTTTATSFTNTGLSTNKVYYYKIKAYRLVGTTKVYSGYTTVVSAKPIPSVPTNFKAASASYSSIKTSWTAVSGASGYEVYRATSSTGTYSLVGKTTMATSFTNTGLSTNKVYYYKIKAYRLVGTTKVYSGYTTVVSAKPIPSVPTNFKAARYSSTSIKTTWSAVTGASGYEMYRATSSTGTYSLIKNTTSLYYTNTGLTTGRTYYYKARAYRLIGTVKVYSGWTAVSSARP
jgi:fibronectin type 3 domain-containing protein